MIVTCSFCQTGNRLPWGKKGKCGRCKRDFTIASLTAAINEKPPVQPEASSDLLRELLRSRGGVI